MTISKFHPLLGRKSNWTSFAMFLYKAWLDKKCNPSLVPRPPSFFAVLVCIQCNTEVEDTVKNGEGLVSFSTWMMSGVCGVDVGRRGPTTKTTHWIIHSSALLAWSKLLVFTRKKLTFRVCSIHIWLSVPPPTCTSISHPLMWWMRSGLPCFSLCLPLPCIILNANPRTKNGGGLGKRLMQP